MDLSCASAWYARGDNEVPVQEAVTGNLRAGDVFYDIGANAGFFGLIAARLVGPTGHVYAFEPVPRVAATIRRSARLNGLSNITVIQAAVSDGSGDREMLVGDHPGGAVISGLGAAEAGSTPLRVRSVSIDDLVGRGEVRPPNFVKIDVEGAETQVLAGMSGAAARHRPVILCEVDAEQADQAAARLARVEGILAQWGYRTRRLERSYPRSAGGWEVEHVLAIPPA